MATKVRDLEKKDDKKKPEASEKPTLKQRSDQRKQRQMQQLESTMAPIESRVGGLEMDSASVGVPASSAEGSPFKFASQKNAPAQTQATETATRGGCGPDGCGVSGMTGTTVTLPPLPTFGGAVAPETGTTTGEPAPEQPASQQPQGEAPADSEATQIVTTPAADFASSEIQAGADPIATVSEARQMKSEVGSRSLSQIQSDIDKYNGYIAEGQNWLNAADEGRNRNQSNWGMFDQVHNTINSFRARVGQLETQRIQVMYNQDQDRGLAPLVASEARLNDAAAVDVQAKAAAVISMLPENVKARAMQNQREMFDLVRSGDIGSALMLKSVMVNENFNTLSAPNPNAVQQNVANAQPGEDGGTAAAAAGLLIPRSPVSKEIVEQSMRALEEASTTTMLGGTLARMKDAAEMSENETSRFAVYADAGQVLAGFYVNKAYQEDPTLATDDPTVASQKIYQRFTLELEAFTTGDAERQAGESLRADPSQDVGAVRGHFMLPAQLLRKGMEKFIVEQVQQRQPPTDESPITRYMGRPIEEEATGLPAGTAKPF